MSVFYEGEPGNCLQVSAQARQLIRDLLARDPMKRLGSLRGAHDIKIHPFFHNINWPLIRCMVRVPFRVKL